MSPVPPRGRAGHFTVCAQQTGESRLICTGGASGAHQTLALRSAFGAPRLQWLLRDPATSKCHFFFYELFLALRLQLSSSLLSFQSLYKFQVFHLFCRVKSLTPTDRSVKHFLLHMYDRSSYTEKKKKSVLLVAQTVNRHAKFIGRSYNSIVLVLI